MPFFTHELLFIAHDRRKRLRFAGRDADWDWREVYKSACRIVEVPPIVDEDGGLKRVTIAVEGVPLSEAIRLMGERGLVPLHCKAAMLDETEESDIVSAAPSPLPEQMETAIYFGKAAEVQRLLNAGVDPNHVNSMGISLLTSAASAGHIDVLERLLSAGAEPNLDDNQPLIPALHEEKYEAVRFLIEHGVDTHRGIREFGTSLMHLLASRKPPLGAVEFLLDVGVDPNGGNRYGESPLARAQKMGWSDIAALLIDRGAR